jgi:CheY-like chemotaxis protein
VRDHHAMSERPSILAVEPHPVRANALAHLVHDYVEANVVVVSASAEVALSVMARRMPELILLSAFTPPGDERSLIAFLRNSAQASVPVLIMSPVHDPSLEKSRTWQGVPWLSRRCSAIPPDFVREALGARMRSALEKSREQLEERTYLRSIDVGDASQTVRDWDVHVRRAHRWATSDRSPLSSVRLPSGFVGQLMNISNSGLLIESDSARMPGSSVMFEFADPNQELTRIWRLDTDLTVPAHLVRSEVSKIGPDRFRYRVAARFIHELELLADVPADWIDRLQFDLCAPIGTNDSALVLGDF